LTSAVSVMRDERAASTAVAICLSFIFIMR